MKDKRKKFILFLITLMISFFVITPNAHAIKFTTASSNSSGLKADLVYCDDYTIRETGEKIYERGSYNRIFIKYIIRPDGTREDWNKEYEA